MPTLRQSGHAARFALHTAAITASRSPVGLDPTGCRTLLKDLSSPIRVRWGDSVDALIGVVQLQTSISLSYGTSRIPRQPVQRSRADLTADTAPDAPGLVRRSRQNCKSWRAGSGIVRLDAVAQLPVNSPAPP